MATTVDILNEILSENCVDLGKPEARRERAARLTNEGCTVEDLNELVAWAHRSHKKRQTVGTWLQWATRTHERWADSIAAIRKWKAANELVVPLSSVQPEAETEKDRESRLRGMAHARVRGDRVRPELVALELGISIERVNELVASEEETREALRQELRKTGSEVW